MKALTVLAAACCALALGACGNLPNEKVLEDFNPPVVSRLETTSSPAPSESVVLADRILRRESGALLMEAGRRRTLAHEIGSMLSRLRDAYPATAEVTARQTHGFGTILVAFEPDLFDAVSGLLDDATGPVALRTGHAEFDALNARLGLWGVKLFSFSPLAVFYVDEHANTSLASLLYSALDGIDYAQPDMFLGDGSDIEASKVRGTWHVVLQRAWGDCPAGCLHREFQFFTVGGSRVSRHIPAQAASTFTFAALLAERGWQEALPPDAR